MIVTSLTATRSNAASESFEQALSTKAAGLLAVFATWRHRQAARRQLAQLSEHLLLDIGLEPDAALTEIAKPFWRG